ncbi:MAG: hypothetical protein O2967_16750 [Proteobacteria bacterium]|nr:hypothetical protein [Pseudomonadota bacterium]
MNLEYSSDIAFTPAVKAVPQRKGLRKAYARMGEPVGKSTSKMV